MNLFKLIAVTVGFVLSIGSGLLITSCKKNDDGGNVTPTPSSSSDYLTFGHFYGMCGGEECVEIFKLSGHKLQEDNKDEYPNQSSLYVGNFIDLPKEKFALTKDLMKYFPDSLLTANNNLFGCPDCADGGGLYIEYNFNNTQRFWYIDQSKHNVPAYLYVFMDKVNEKIELINK